MLPRLQAAAVELPYPDDKLPEDELDVRLTQEEMRAVASAVSGLLDQIDWTRIQDELHESTGDSRHRRHTHAFLADDLYDIYHDLKDGLDLIAAGRPESEAVFYWRLHFWGHWGYHNVDANRVIHYYVALFLDR